MSKYNFKNLAILAVIALFVGSVLGCEDNNNLRRSRTRYPYRTTLSDPRGATTVTGDPRSAGSGTDPRAAFVGQGPLSTAGSRSDSRPGTDRSVMHEGSVGSSGAVDPVSSILRGLGLGRIVGIGRGTSHEFSDSEPATRSFPYLLDTDNMPNPWASVCDRDPVDTDGDGICDKYESDKSSIYVTALHPEAYNGFVAFGGSFSEGQSYTTVNALDDIKSFEEALADLLENPLPVKTNAKVGSGKHYTIVNGGWQQQIQVANWGTRMKKSLFGVNVDKRPNANISKNVLGFYTVNEIGIGDQGGANPLLEKTGDKSFVSFPGFGKSAFVSDEDNKRYVACYGGFFRKPQGSAGTEFRLQLVDSRADDAAIIAVDGTVAAYSIRLNHGSVEEDNFKSIKKSQPLKALWNTTKKFSTWQIEKAVAESKIKNVLSFTINDDSYHSTYFCVLNEKGPVQAQVRYRRDISKKDVGYIPLLPIDFRVRAPSETEYDALDGMWLHDVSGFEMDDSYLPRVPSRPQPTEKAPAGSGEEDSEAVVGRRGPGAEGVDDAAAKIRETEAQLAEQRQLVDMALQNYNRMVHELESLTESEKQKKLEEAEALRQEAAQREAEAADLQRQVLVLKSQQLRLCNIKDVTPPMGTDGFRLGGLDKPVFVEIKCSGTRQGFEHGCNDPEFDQKVGILAAARQSNPNVIFSFEAFADGAKSVDINTAISVLRVNHIITKIVERLGDLDVVNPTIFVEYPTKYDFQGGTNPELRIIRVTAR